MAQGLKRKPKLFFGEDDVTPLSEVKVSKEDNVEEESLNVQKNKPIKEAAKTTMKKDDKKLKHVVKLKREKAKIEATGEKLKKEPDVLTSANNPMSEIKARIQAELDEHKLGTLEETEEFTESQQIRGKSSKLMTNIKAQIESELQQHHSLEEHEVQHTAEGRLHTGIPGLDDVMEGGYREGTINLIGGGAGCGKSIFCMQFLVDGIDNHDETGIYISFEEGHEKILEDFKKQNWDLKNKIKKRKLALLYYSPEQVQKVLEKGGGVIRDLIQSMGAKRLVIDSLTAFTLLHDGELARRKAVLKLFDALKKWGITALMTSEQEPDPDKHISTILEFEADGVILLYNVRKGDVRERSLEIFKMRGTEHSAKIFPMTISKEGILIYPEQTVY